MSDAYRRRSPARRTRTMTQIYPEFKRVDLYAPLDGQGAEPETTGAPEPLQTDRENMPSRTEDAIVIMTALAVFLLFITVIMVLWR